MKTVWKFPLKPTGVQKISMPRDSTILTVQRQDQFLSLWALIETDKEPVDRFFMIAMSGKPLPNKIERYIGTFQVPEQNFVGHIFEIKGESGRSEQ